MMPFDKDTIEQRLLEIRLKDSMSEEEMAETVKPLFENPAFRNFLKSEGIESPIDMFIGPEEMQMMEDNEKIWTEFINDLFLSLELFCARDEEEFYSSLIKLGKSIDEICMAFIEADQIIMAIPGIFKDCDMAYYAFHENKIWVTIYLNIVKENGKEAILNYLNGTEGSMGTTELPDVKKIVQYLLAGYKEKGDLFFNELKRIRMQINSGSF